MYGFEFVALILPFLIEKVLRKRLSDSLTALGTEWVDWCKSNMATMQRYHPSRRIKKLKTEKEVPDLESVDICFLTFVMTEKPEGRNSNVHLQRAVQNEEPLFLSFWKGSVFKKV